MHDSTAQNHVYFSSNSCHSTIRSDSCDIALIPSVMHSCSCLTHHATGKQSDAPVGEGDLVLVQVAQGYNLLIGNSKSRCYLQSREYGIIYSALTQGSKLNKSSEELSFKQLSAPQYIHFQSDGIDR